jgi:adenylate cyclase
MITKEKEELLKYYNQGLAAFKQRKWDDAINLFEMALRVVPGDGPSELYLERAREFKVSPPPPDWDGVTTMTTK